MVGKGATLNIIHKTSQKGREYADISAIMPVMQGMEAQVPDRARFVIPTGDEVLAPIQQAPVVQPVQPMQAPLQTATQVTVDQPQQVPAQQPVQQPVQQPAPQPQQATMGTQFTGPQSTNVPF